MKSQYMTTLDDQELSYMAKPVKVPNGCVKTTEPKPPTYSYHYNNPESQGALMAETNNFPSYYNPKKQQFHSAYSDRLLSWDAVNYKKLCDFIGTGDQGWNLLATKPDKFLREAAKIAFQLDKLPKHVQVIHYKQWL